VSDNFFAVGGTLMLAGQLAARIRGALTVELSVGELCLTPTVADLADLLDEQLDRQRGVEGTRE
jgi:hypothetical protein